MGKLQAFFREHAGSREVKVDFVVSKRFKDEHGNPIPWKLAALMPHEMDEIRKASTTMDLKTKTVDFDSELYQKNLMCLSVVYPDLENAELQDNYGVSTPAELLTKMLNGGEYSRLLAKVNELNGGDIEEDYIKEKKDEAKNG
ncbi:MAG: phage portal protein [Eubacteriales bacterium]|nr:phage portal protein [Eubacteriales bacterium]